MAKVNENYTEITRDEDDSDNVTLAVNNVEEKPDDVSYIP